MGETFNECSAGGGVIEILEDFSDTLFFDDHDDESLSATLWGTPVLVGSTVVTESSSAPNTLRIYNPGTGTLGAGYVPSVDKFGRNVSVRSKIDLHSSVNCFARIELYKDGDDYVYFGARKDGTADSRVYLWHNIAAAGVVTVDINATDTDNIAREYRIDVSEENLMFYVDDILVYTLKDASLDNYYIRPYAASFANGDVLDIRFDYNKVLRFAEDRRLLLKKLLQIQGGDSSIGSVVSALDSSLDLGYAAGSVTPTDGTENDIYNESDDTAFKHCVSLIDLTNSAADDEVKIREYAKVDSSTEVMFVETTYTGVQTIKGIRVNAGEGLYGVRIALVQNAAGTSYKTYKYLNVDEQA